MASPSTPLVYQNFIDITPELTLSTIQFSSETVNTIVSSILVVLILVNFNSVVHKLVSLTHRNHFNYASYLRSYIFSSSDDPSRLISWLKGENSYLPEHWPQTKKKVVRSRLFYPLLARTLIFVLSIGSIALTIPGNREFNNCGAGDFTPRINFGGDSGDRVANSICSSTDLFTARGETNSTLNFCADSLFEMPDGITINSENTVVVHYDDDKAQVSTFFANDGSDIRGFAFYLEWTKSSRSKLRSRFLEDELDVESHFAWALQALNLDERSNKCAFDETLQSKTESGNSYTASRTVNCSINPQIARTDAEYVARTGLQWVRMDTLQSRVEVTAGEDDRDYADFGGCPYTVSVSRPIVNLVPLAVALVMVFTFNLAVGFTIADRGDINEVSYHIMKEALGLDITCNPLQESAGNERGVGGSHLPLIEFQEFNCPDGTSAHGGFFVGEGDVEGHIEFGRRNITTCSCTMKTVNLGGHDTSAV